jgi:hypothetical protein
MELLQKGRVKAHFRHTKTGVAPVMEHERKVPVQLGLFDAPTIQAVQTINEPVPSVEPEEDFMDGADMQELLDQIGNYNEGIDRLERELQEPYLNPEEIDELESELIRTEIARDKLQDRLDAMKPTKVVPVVEVEKKEPVKADVRRAVETIERDDMDPLSENYRYRDTGYIPGSRKELAAEQIRIAGRNGTQLRGHDIDWDELEQNSRLAEKLIIKSNIFGQVDWEKLKADGMDPNAGFLIDRIYASLAPKPSEDTPVARKDFAFGLETLRDRLEKCKTVADVTGTLKELKDELLGIMMNGTETEEILGLRKKADAIFAKADAGLKEMEKKSKEANQYSAIIQNLRWDQTKRERRGWKPDPDIVKKIKEYEALDAQKRQEYVDFREAHPELVKRTVKLGEGWTRFTPPILDEFHEILGQIDTLTKGIALKNQIENPLTRAWSVMGEKFTGVLNYRSHKGSKTFQNHVATAMMGKIADWSWTEKTKTVGPRATKEQVRFQLKVADKIERIGGRQVAVGSTEDLKKSFGLRDIQSGNWVLRDPASAKFHVENAAMAFSDLSDIIGIPDGKIAVGGKLALAFGARGHGAEGWRTTAPAAHYEPIDRVINLTKFNGGGTLAHEWFHSLDNMIDEITSPGTASKAVFMGSEYPDNIKHPEVKKAYKNLIQAIASGEHRPTTIIEFTDGDIASAKYNLDQGWVRDFQRGIKEAKTVQDAFDHINMYFEARPDNKKEQRNKQNWIRIAAAYHGDPKEKKVVVKTGTSRSMFAMEALSLDEGVSGKYWSSNHEMASRAFQAYVEDKLSGMGRKNDYLSAFADNKYYKSPLGDQKPYPEGDERKRINAEFDKFFATLNQISEFRKAFIRGL